MNKLLIALFAIVAVACSNVGSRATDQNRPIIETNVASHDPLPTDTMVEYIGKEMYNGRMTQEEAFNIMNVSLPKTSPQGIPLLHKFFPASTMANAILVRTDDVGNNCAYTLPYSWTIDCDYSALVHCKIAITVPDQNDPLYGTWVFTKECDEQPIGNWTLYGLTVNYSSVIHIF